MSRARRGSSLAAFAAAVLTTALAACGPGLPVNLEPESRDFYEKARLVMTGPEEDIFLHLPDAEARREFIKDFWERRDPDPATEPNEFREELERRLDHIARRFKEGGRGINTDRGRIYYYLGAPDKTDEYNEPPDANRVGPILVWTYYRYDVGILFYDVRGDGTYSIQEIVGDLMNAMEMAKLGETYTGGKAPSKYINFDMIYDAERKELRITLPLKGLSFMEADGRLRAEFRFSFAVYVEGGAKRDEFEESRSLEGKAEELEKMKTAAFTFPRPLPPGKTFVDVILATRTGEARSRKIFTFRVTSPACPRP
jgi:GWxTD domain-containing protein